MTSFKITVQISLPYSLSMLIISTKDANPKNDLIGRSQLIFFLFLLSTETKWIRIKKQHMEALVYCTSCKVTPRPLACWATPSLTWGFKKDIFEALAKWKLHQLISNLISFFHYSLQSFILTLSKVTLCYFIFRPLHVAVVKALFPLVGPANKMSPRE